MFGIGLPEFGVIALVALLVMGPDKLPGLAKQAGGMVRTLKRMSEGVRDDLREHLGPEYADLELRDLHPRTFVRNQLSAAWDEDDADELDDVDEDSQDAEDAVGEQPRR
jgi:sec-independent protein translocase protein TatB